MIFLFTKNPNLKKKKKQFFLWGGGGGADGQTDKLAQTNWPLQLLRNNASMFKLWPRQAQIMTIL